MLKDLSWGSQGDSPPVRSLRFRVGLPATLCFCQNKQKRRYVLLNSYRVNDVDVCVEMEPRMFLVVRLQRFLEQLLQCPVDVIHMHPHINKYLLNDINRDGIYVINWTQQDKEHFWADWQCYQSA